MLYGGLRIGLYGPIKHALGVSSSESGLIRKIAAGMLGGALAAGVCNPTDLIKTRLQAQGSTLRGPFAVLGSVIRHEGVRGLWKGTTPSMARAALLTAAQCATYDEVKLLFVRNLGWEDTLGTHFAVSTLAGLATSTVISPVDMIKTNMFIHTKYSGPWECTRDIMRTQGVRGFFKGFAANWARQGPMTTVIFVTLEALRQEFGIEEP
ncbi:hypothetical protein H632_c613p0 [Helicosporidium sp. ATCC 50920]|nr:hypothetical protein H632_c613p0 [Helicosporidium sp. ATCC 50920]|eukprot:KDD75570.1 hypothetical protein H632_c613p0 [Helicosporidium sp. ATCC 50920]